MQLMPIMASPLEMHPIENQEAMDAELFLSLLEALSVDAAAPQTLGIEAKAPLDVVVAAPDAKEDDTDFALAAVLLSLVATPVPLEPMAQQESEALSPEEIAPVDVQGLIQTVSQSPLLSESVLVNLLQQLEASPIELPGELKQELEALVAVATGEHPQETEKFLAPKFGLTAPVSLPAKEQIQVEQAVLASLEPLFGPKEPDREQPLFFALFPPQVEPQSFVDSPQTVAPLVYLVPPEAESQEEPLSNLPQAIASVLEPEKPSFEEQVQDPPDPGFILNQGSKASETSKLDAPPAPHEPYSFEEVMSRATVRVGKQIQELAVRIQPQSLGKVLLRVAVEEGQLVAKFLTESNQAKGILELNLPQLRESLAKEGLVLERCQVALGWSQEFGQEQRQEHRSRYRPPRRAVNYEEHLTQSEPGEQVGLVNFLA